MLSLREGDSSVVKSTDLWDLSAWAWTPALSFTLSKASELISLSLSLLVFNQANSLLVFKQLCTHRAAVGMDELLYGKYLEHSKCYVSLSYYYTYFPDEETGVDSSQIIWLVRGRAGTWTQAAWLLDTWQKAEAWCTHPFHGSSEDFSPNISGLTSLQPREGLPNTTLSDWEGTE